MAIPTRDPSDGFRIRAIFFSSLCLPIALLLLWHFFYIQVTRHAFYLDKAQELYIARTEIHGKRGEIFDCNGYLLVGNQPCVEISATPCNLKDDAQRSKTAALMAKYLDRDYDYYYRKLAPEIRRKQKDGRLKTVPNTYQMIARFAPSDAGNALRQELRKIKVNFNTVNFRDTSRRTYPKGKLLSNVLGYTNIINDFDVPQSGLERQLNEEITQHTGHKIYTRRRDGQELDYGLNIYQQSQDGKNVYLTISEPIQAILEEELDQGMIEHEPKAIYAAIADPATGKILALGQRPSFDPNDRATFIPAAITTRIAEDAYEPGSVVKPFIVSKALDWGVITPDMIFDGEHGCWKEERNLRDTHDYGMMDVATIIQKSSNIGTAKIGKMLGKSRVYQALIAFGAGQKTGLPFPLESSGRIKAPKDWDKYSITRFPIGYGTMWSPLQLIRAYCGIANGGMMPQLRLIDHYEDAKTGEISTPPVGIHRRIFIRPETASTITGMMTKVTKPGGTARRAGIPGYEVAGKTGTSHKVVNGHYDDRQKMASFIGFVPANAPRLVMLVTVDAPSKGRTHGGDVAGPIFSRTAKRVLQLLNIPPDQPIPTK